LKDLPVHITGDKTPEIEFIVKGGRTFARCRTQENLRECLAKSGGDRIAFSAHPISGEPEIFHLDKKDAIITRKRDGHQYEMDEFVGYAFQCDPEGYSHTEYVDISLEG
jgi:hypothetical protein